MDYKGFYICMLQRLFEVLTDGKLGALKVVGQEVVAREFQSLLAGAHALSEIGEALRR
jgi:hypothetical protein